MEATMRLNSKWLVVLLTLSVISMSGCGFTQKLRARDNMNKGVKAFTDQKYDAAAQYFEKAVELDQNSDFTETARMYQAISYQSQFIPGSTDPRSHDMAVKSIETFELVIDKARNPAKPNRDAMLGIASLYYQMKEYEKSKEWCRRVLEIDPTNAEAYYRIAVIDYDDAFDRTGIQGELVELMTPEERETTRANVDEALACLDKALEIRPDYFDAMEYQNLLWREKAKFETDEKIRADLNHQANLVAQKALALKLKAQEEAAKAPRKLGQK
jgi:tetratricopeptide (TPR) repeat protein